ncbi:MAG TPA: terminase [Clostridiales bacterium]|nr:MAG: terminase [Clostridiales bacterium GWD2_32_59]HAN09372.1 terminase [Clostridiales bacterium]
MPRKAINKETIKKNTISDMTKLGVYKPEYDRVIDIYSELCEQYEKFTKKFVDGGYRYQTETMQGGAKKSPILATLETLRKDILAYSDRLCLNPKSLESVTTENPKKSRLSEALSMLE